MHRPETIKTFDFRLPSIFQCERPSYIHSQPKHLKFGYLAFSVPLTKIQGARGRTHHYSISLSWLFKKLPFFLRMTTVLKSTRWCDPLHLIVFSVLYVFGNTPTQHHCLVLQWLEDNTVLIYMAIPYYLLLLSLHFILFKYYEQSLFLKTIMVFFIEPYSYYVI